MCPAPAPSAPLPAPAPALLAAASEAERVQYGHLRLFTRWLLAWLVGYAAINAVVASVYRDLRIAICGIAFAVVAARLVAILRRLDRVRVADAALQVAASLVFGSVVVLFAYPPAANATALMPIASAAMLLPYQANGRLRLLMILAGAISVSQILLGLVLPFSTTAPAWLVTFYTTSGYGAGIVLVMVVLWQYQARWSRIVSTLSGANRLLDDQAAALSAEIAERQRAEEASGRLQVQLNQSQKMESVGRLAGGVAHDFNNLLTVINGYAELAQAEPGLTAEGRESLEMIAQAGQTASELTRQLLAFSRRQVLQPRTVDLNTLVPEMNRMMRRLIGADVTLATRLAGDLWPVRVDPTQVQQVLLNLAVNARDAMPGGGTLTIETANVELDEDSAQRHPGLRPGPHVMLVVSDTGVGMDEETQRRIFEPFFTTKGDLGSGLGLATVYGIVQQSGGAISVYSERGFGTAFKIHLPRQEGVADAVPGPSPRAHTRAGDETILLAEDSEAVRVLATKVLTAAGYQVLAARDGDEAVRIAAGHPGRIHLLMTDVVMPGTGGRAAAERIRAARPDIRVIYMSGYTEDGIITRQILTAGIEFLAKPFTPTALAAKVAAVLAAAPDAS